jgi:hypothetical protein
MLTSKVFVVHTNKNIERVRLFVAGNFAGFFNKKDITAKEVN